jgi:anti-anti-sigma regulatory factor
MVAMQTSDIPRAQRLEIEKFSEGPITCLRFKGTIDEKFEGKKLAGTIKAKKMVLDLGQVHKISSFGVREWLSFMNALEKAAQHIYLINCTPKVVNQINMVANFLGKALVFSFYAPYHCDNCEKDGLVLLNVDRDFDSIKRLKAPERPCPSCGNATYLDEDAPSFFSNISQQPQFELDPQVTTFLISKLNYAVSDLARRVQCEKFLEDRNTYVKLVGNLDGSFPGDKLAEGLEGTIILDVSGIGGIDPAGAAEFRRFMGLIMNSVESIHFIGCQPQFLLRSTQAEDLGEKVQVLSFALPYTCQKCATTATQAVDVLQHYEVLKLSMPPQNKCDVCSGPTVCSAGGDILSHLPNLPKPHVDGALLKFIKKAQKRKPEKRREAKGAGGASNMALPMAAVAVVAIGAIVAVTFLRPASDGSRPSQGQETKRPGWITSATPASGYCTDLSNRTVCVGVSSYQRTKEGARSEATHSALEALAHTVGLRIDNPEFRDQVRPIYSDTRRLALAELEVLIGDEAQDGFDRAINVARRARKQVADGLQRSGGDAAPTQIADWYWEEYKALSGEGTEFLVFVRFDVSEAQASSLVNRYALHSEALGAKVLTAFPSIGWRYPDVVEGAVLVAVQAGSPAQQMGLEERDIVLAVNDEKVRDAEELSSKLKTEYDKAKQSKGKLKLLVKKGDGPPIEQTATVAANGSVQIQTAP